MEVETNSYLRKTYATAWSASVAPVTRDRELAQMVQYSNEILNLFGAFDLQHLTECGANELGPKTRWDLFDNAFWNHVFGIAYPNKPVQHLQLTFLRRAYAAVREYDSGRSALLRFVTENRAQKHNLSALLTAITHFEQCIGQVWQAVALHNRMEHAILNSGVRRITAYTAGEGSDLERTHMLYNVIKHFDVDQAAVASSPIWITNSGLKCNSAFVSFAELEETITSLVAVAEEIFVTIPREARRRHSEIRTHNR